MDITFLLNGEIVSVVDLPTACALLNQPREDTTGHSDAAPVGF